MVRGVVLFVAISCIVTGLSAQSTQLATGRAVRATLATGDTLRYRIALDSNSIARLVVDQQSVDVVVRVIAPGGRRVAQVDGPRRGLERVQFEATASGDYQVLVYPFKEESGEVVTTLVTRERLASDPGKLVDQLLAPLDRRDSPGAVVSVWRGGKTLFSKAYGMANLTYNVPFTTGTPTNIGSTSKQFTAFAVMLLVDRGQVDLDEDVRVYIPELPDLGRTVTVRHLLTHTSGYREFLNTLVMTGRRLDHGDFIDRSELISIVQRQPALQNEPGAEWNYNNTGYGLAAVIVERVSGLTFPEFMAANVFGPLGMTQTQVRANPEQIVPGMSEGYTPGENGNWRAIGDLGGAMGAGGIYSTVADLQKWARNLLHPTVGNPALIKEMMTPFRLSNGKSTGYGMGLFIDTQGPLQRIHHGGADVAHRSQLVLYPEIDAGITVQSNNAGFDSGLAFRFAEAFFGDALRVKPVASTTGYDPATFVTAAFDDYVGRYALDAAPAFILTFSRTGDSLFTQATGQQRVRIYPTSDSTFELRVVKASVTFHRDSSGKVNAATLHQNGNQRATRLPGDAEKAWLPTVGELLEFAGRYYSEELETFHALVLEDSVLTLKQPRVEPVKMVSGADDTFTAGGLTLSFERDRNGQVIAYYASNGRTRNVRFVRQR
jgi:CubicO group peptidase (beta-lactamase class C family)